MVDPATQRREARAHTEADERAARALLVAHNVPLPVIFEPADQPTVDAPDPAPDVKDCRNDLYLVRSSDGKRKYKVQKKRQLWTCSCPKWRKSRGLDCQHIKRVFQMSDTGQPYATARRRPSKRIIYPENQPKENTRRARAYFAMPHRVPELFESLCRMIQPDEGSVVREGAPPVPLAVRAYALLTKCFERLTYQQLSARLATDLAVERLGWERTTRLAVNTLSTMMRDPRLQRVFEDMLATTGRTGRRIETSAAIDASGLPTVMVSNYKEAKYGKQRGQNNRAFVKVHWAAGQVTNLICALHVTMDHGLGSGDAVHYGKIARTVLRTLPNLEDMLGDGAYGNKGNYLRSEAYGIRLLTRQRIHEDRSKWGGQAAEVAELQRLGLPFTEKYRFRSKGETPPSRVKRRNPYQRLRRHFDDGAPPTLEERPDGALCDLPDEQLDAILERACGAVGKAQVNEAFAMVVGENVQAIVMLEHLHDDKINFVADPAFVPMLRIKEADLLADQKLST